MLRALLAAAAVTLASLTGCAADTGADDGEGDVGETEDALSQANGVEVIQCNPFYSGAYEKPDRSSPKNWHTMNRFAQSVADHHTHTAIIGMEEIGSAADADHIVGILNAWTGRTWKVQWFGGKTGSTAPATGEAIFWRPAVFDLKEVYGTREIEDLDNKSGPDTSWRFGGLLLERKGTQRRLAVFAGKLARLKGVSDGNLIDNGDRAREVRTLKAWIDDKTKDHPHASRVVMMDMNAGYGSAPHKEMKKSFDDGGDTRPTHFAYGKNRFDYVFWDFDSGKSRPDGIFGKPQVSGDFGSDHRYVTAKVYVGAAQ